MNIQWMMRLKALWYLGISVEKATETLQHTSPHTTEKMSHTGTTHSILKQLYKLVATNTLFIRN